MRVAVVELGSRAVRSLIADLGEDRLDPVKTSSRPISLGKFVDASDREVAQVVSQLKALIQEFRDEAKRNRAQKFAVFGTEAIRKLQARYPDIARAIDPELRVLDPKQEAECSFIAGVTDGDAGTRSGLQYVVIDMGGGSIEIIAGRIKQSVPTITDYVSHTLGSKAISERLRMDRHNLDAFDEWLDKRLDEISIPVPGVGAKTILLGSVPTKAAWLQVRPSPTETYQPRLVGGATLERDAAAKAAEDILAAWRVSPAAARRFVDPRIADDSEIELVVSGLRLLSKILERQERRNCVVSTRGTRFGFAFGLAGRS